MKKYWILKEDIKDNDLDIEPTYARNQFLCMVEYDASREKAIEGMREALVKSKEKFESVRGAKYFNPVKNEWEPSVVNWTAKEQIELIDQRLTAFEKASK